MAPPRIIHRSTWILKRVGTTVFWIYGDDLDGSITINCDATGEVWTGSVVQISSDLRKHKATVTLEEERKDGKDVVDDDLAEVDITVTNDDTSEEDTTTVDVDIV